MAARTEEAKLVRIGGVEFLVDGFQFQRKDVCHYVLTHFHSDHTIGLTRSFASGTIYCTRATAALAVEMLNVEPSRVRGLGLGEALEVPGPGGVRLTLLDADHCPGSAVVAFEAPGGDRLALHTGDCRASARLRGELETWLAGRQVHELFLDTTYCNKRWNFPTQEVACEWLREITREELKREPRTLFVVGSYQIGKERAVRAVAEETDSSAYLEHRRWRVVQLAGWGEEVLPSRKPLWSIDKEGCQVWMAPLGGLGHDILKHILDSAKGEFKAVVAFRPTGWAWSPRRMSVEGSRGCRPWVENEGQTRIYGVPYSEHSSYAELQALATQLRPRKLIPTVNSETQAGKERMMCHFLGVVDLRADRERMDHYLFGQAPSPSGANDLVDVLALSAIATAASDDALIVTSSTAVSWDVAGGSTCGSTAARAAGKQRPWARQCRWGSGMLRSSPAGSVLELEASRERIERAFGHRLYFLASRLLEEGSGAQLDVLGSTGNVYNVKLLPAGNECSCLDFAKAGGVCKHILFVMLRILKLPRDDHRIWQTSLVPSELRPLVQRLASEGSEAAAGVRADDAVLRGYRQSRGEVAKAERRPLPEECPICFDEMREVLAERGGAEVIAFCRTCGHNVHADCQRRWAGVSQGGDVCPLCRSPWALPGQGEDAGPAASGPVNLAAYSAEHRGVSLVELYPETHRWINRRDRQGV